MEGGDCVDASDSPNETDDNLIAYLTEGRLNWIHLKLLLRLKCYSI